MLGTCIARQKIKRRDDSRRGRHRVSAPRKKWYGLYMTSPSTVSRRTFIALSSAIPVALAAPARKIPVGLELYSVRDELAKDLTGTVKAVANMGYEVVEFFSPYYAWTPDYAREVRKLMDDLGIRCNSTHNGANSFTPEGIQKAIELNQILGAKY